MRAPNKSQILDEIVNEIVKQIQCDPDGMDSTEADARTTIAYLRALDREIASRGRLKARTSIRGKKHENINEFGELLKQTKRLEKALKMLPAPALFMLFSGEDDLSLDKVPSGEAQSKVVHRVKQVTAMLAYMRSRSGWLIAEGPGEEHGHSGYRQRRVAREAWSLLRRHRIEPVNGTTGNKPGNTYGNVAELLWRAMTGEKDKDLQRQCKDILRLAKSGDLDMDDGPIIGRGRLRQLS